MAEPTLFDSHQGVKDSNYPPSVLPPGVICGVYVITHVASGRQYVGSSSHIRRRWRDHLRKLNLGTHGNRFLLNAWKKYGPSAFRWEVVETTRGDKLKEAEQRWLYHTKSYRRKCGFNHSPDCIRNAGWHHTPELCHRMSVSRMGHAVHPNTIASLRARSIGNRFAEGHHNNAKLKDADVREIVRRCAAGERSVEVAKAFGIRRQQIDRIRQGDQWKDVTIDPEIAATARNYRYAKGEAVGRAKLTETDVREIRRRVAAGECGADIARTYGVTRRVVYAIRDRVLWKHVA